MHYGLHGSACRLLNARTMRARPHVAVGALALATVLSLARAPRAEGPRVVERVVAVVDGQPILASELRRRAAPHERALGRRELPAWRLAELRRVLLRETLRRLVEERLILGDARARHTSVSDDEIERAFDAIAAQNGLDRTELEASLEVHGWTRAEYRRELSAQVLEGKLLAERVRGRGDWKREREEWLKELRRRAWIEVFLAP